MFPILICLLILLVWTLAHRTRRRKLFTVQTKKLVLRDQNFRCSICRMNAGIWDYDHKDGNRGDNKASNCQVLCPTCHTKKSRGLPTRDTYPRIIKHIPYLIAPCPVIAMCRDKKEIQASFFRSLKNGSL